MTAFFSLCVLAFAVSVDSFGAGLSYGLRRLRLPFYSLICISLCSSVSVLAGGVAAELLKQYIPTAVTEAVGGFILILIGLWAIIQVLKDSPSREHTDGERKKTDSSGKKQGIWKQFLSILKEPDEADWDRSGTISAKEAVFLGAALSLDAFGAGMGSALLGFSSFSLAAAVGLMCALFLSGGMKGGRKLAGTKFMQKCSFLPGLLLIGLGIWNLQ
ncbi:sporulation membrane protein YtaF [Salibacterium aidingense]|uniref:sporulation membrane protein YtaF n=1 Tax=Salibacterium aidingense TaxID=384933 RepID=UPI0004004504|nr:sporulation membrane protein YtaF [Salibacterium aidingense]